MGERSFRRGHKQASFKVFVPVSTDLRYNVPAENMEYNRWPNTDLY